MTAGGPPAPAPPGGARVRLHIHIDLAYEIHGDPADFIFNIHPALTARQTVCAERLELSQAVDHVVHVDAATGNRYLRLRAQPGELKVSYQATVDMSHCRTDPALVEEVPVRHLPLEVLSYVYPSRYCESDRLVHLAIRAFGGLRQGHQRVAAIEQWVRAHVDFLSNSSDSRTSAVDTLVSQKGVCRDFAHLMIALCRAVNIPARFVTGTDYGADPSLGPPDFHAYVEAYLGGRWYLFDPSGTAIPMGLMRFGTGRDAADVAFATVFGPVEVHAPMVRGLAVEDGTRGIVLPVCCADALSTDGPCDDDRC